MRSPALAIAMFVVAAGTQQQCGVAEEDLPAVRTQLNLEPRDPCFSPPDIRAERRPLVTSPTNPGHCVASSLDQIMAKAAPLFKRDTVPVEISIAADGGVASIRFYDSCLGVTYDVDEATAECVRRDLREWHYAPESQACPRVEFVGTDEIQLSPPTKRVRKEAVLSTGCGRPVG